LAEIDLQGLDLRQAIFRGANLQEANLRGAQLQGADLSGSDTNLLDTDFHNAVLSQALLQDVDLTPAKNLLPGQLAGTDLTGAQVPPIIQGFLNKPGNLEEVAHITGSLFVTVLSACVYVWLTVFATTDAGLLTNMATSKLPIFSVDIPIAWFYWTAPCLLLSMYVYFHLTLQRQWDGLASLPAFYPDGRRLDQNSYPWLLNSLVGAYIPNLAATGRNFISYLQVITAIFFAWWVVPITIGLVWFRYLTRHDSLWSSFHVAVLWATLGFGFYSWYLAKSTLRGKLGGLGFKLMGRDFFSMATAGVVAGIALLIPLVSYGVIRGIPPEIKLEPGAPTPMLGRAVPWFLIECVGYNPFADLRNAEVSLKPAKWTGDVRKADSQERQGHGKGTSVSPLSEKALDKETPTLLPEEIAQVKGAPLQARDLRYVRGKRAFLIKAELQNKKGPDFQGADLQGAYLAEADLRYANLETASLNQALLNNALLSGATLQNANLRRVTASLANFTGANLQGTDFQEAELCGAIFVGAKLSGANFAGALLQEADFRKVDDLETAQLRDKARLWVLAYYDERMIRELKLPLDHNNRLKDKDLSSYDLRRLNLAKADLSGMNLTWARLQRSNFSEADLSKAICHNANFKGAFLRLAELREADLRGAVGLNADKVKEAKTWVLAKYDEPLRQELGLPANHNIKVDKKELRGYSLENTNLTGADLSQINLVQARFTRGILRQAKFDGANLRGADFTGAKLSKASFAGANIQGATFAGNQDFNGKKLKEARFWRFAYYDAKLLADLGLASNHNDCLKNKKLGTIELAQENLAGVDFSGMDLRGAKNLQGVNLKEANLENANLEGVNLAGAVLLSANLKGARLQGVRGLTDVQGARNWFLAAYDLEILKSLGLPADHNQRLAGRGPGKDLSHYLFNRKFLSRGDFSQLILAGANFQESYLFSANFYGADLKRADFTGAFLGGARFLQADLSGAKFAGANLKGADFLGAHGLEQTEIIKGKNWVLAQYDAVLLKDLGLPDRHNTWAKDQDLSRPGYHFAGKSWEGADFSEIKLVGADFNGATLRRADFSLANLEQAHLLNADCLEANLERANLKAAKLAGSNLAKAILRGADLSGADLSGAKLDGANLQGAQMSGAILTGTSLKKVDLRGVKGLTSKQLESAEVDKNKLPQNIK